MAAPPIQYPEGLHEIERDEYTFRFLLGKEDSLFYDERNLVFRSTLVRECLQVIKRKYPDLEETQQNNLIKLESEEGTTSFKSSVKVLVHGKALREKFERDFEEMKQNAQTQSLETTPQHEEHEMPAPPERCLTGLSDREREDKLQANKDFLFYYERKEEEFTHVFRSTLVREWLDVMKRKYPNLEKTQQDNLIELKSEEGTILFYSSVEVLVHGRALREKFDEDFEEMKQKAQTPSLATTPQHEEHEMPTLPIQYPEGHRYRTKLLLGKKDSLFYDERNEEKLNLVFCSTLVREWLDVLKKMYPDLKETQQNNLIKLESKEGTIYFMSSVKVLVHGKALRETFERDFEEMKQNVQTQSLVTPQHEEHEMRAPPERCLKGLSRREREDKLQANKDFLFYDERKEEKFNLIFCSTLVREWLDVMKRKYPNLEETQQDDLIKLNSEEGTISFYSSVEVVVDGEELIKKFKEGFKEMKQKAQTSSLEAGLAQLNVNQPEQTAEE